MSYTINRVAVIGSGTMGAAIAAHLANVGIPSYLLDIVPREPTDKEKAAGLTLADGAVRNRIVDEGLKRCVEARTRYEATLNAIRLYEEGPDGQRRYLSSEEIDSARADAKKTGDEFCAGL